MIPRIDYRKFSPDALQAMLALERHLAASGFEHKLMHLLKLRASQINGCAYASTCIRSMPAPPAKPNSGSTRWTRGAKRRFSTTASAPRWPGLKR